MLISFLLTLSWTAEDMNCNMEEACHGGIMTLVLMCDSARVLATLATGTFPRWTKINSLWGKVMDCVLNVVYSLRAENKCLRGQWLRLCATSL